MTAAITEPMPRTHLLSWTDMEQRVNYRLVLPGPPRTKKNSGRIINVGKHKVIAPSVQWLAWRDECRAYAFQHPELRLMLSRPVNCRALFFRDADRGDASGYYDGLGDVLQELEVVINDRWLVSWDGSRLMKSAEHPRTEIVLTVLNEATTDE
jgi:hypothetical protein